MSRKWKNYFVTVVYDGVPSQLLGPNDYDGAVQTALKALEDGKNQHGPVDITDEIRDAVDVDGQYQEDSLGVFIIQPEENSGDEPE